MTNDSQAQPHHTNLESLKGQKKGVFLCKYRITSMFG